MQNKSQQAYFKAYYEAHKEHILQVAKDYRETHRKMIRQKARKNQKTYRIKKFMEAHEDYFKRRAEQKKKEANQCKREQCKRNREKREAQDLCAIQMQVRLGVDDSLSHKEMLSYYFSNPNQIEQGFRPLEKEFGAGKGRIDILGVDAHNRLCIVEIKTRNQKMACLDQMVQYQVALLRVFEALHYYDTHIRMLLITPSRVIDYGTSSKSAANPIIAQIKKDPCSRDPFR